MGAYTAVLDCRFVRSCNECSPCRLTFSRVAAAQNGAAGRGLGRARCGVGSGSVAPVLGTSGKYITLACARVFQSAATALIFFPGRGCVTMAASGSKRTWIPGCFWDDRHSSVMGERSGLGVGVLGRYL